MKGPGPLARVHLFPVRHHSPRTSAVLAAFLDEARPELVLVEAPEDAEPLVPALVDPGTVPPVAILGYRTDGVPASSLWPFAAYSPEYVAVRWAATHGARVGFVDIPVSLCLGDRADDDLGPDPDLEEDEAPPAPSERAPSAPAVDVRAACAEARGFRSFEEFWEASFEAPAYDAAAFRAALLAYADLVRSAERSVVHRARDAHMAQKILAAVAAGTVPEKIVAVLGAAHAAALLAGEVDPGLLSTLPAPAPTQVTLVPFSFPRLAEQLGYGAGNRAPQFYQRAHEAGCSYTRATLEVLVELTEHLRLRGFSASLADTLEAYRLAVALAGLRAKAEPGLDEVREAAVATLCRGDATHVDGFLWPTVVGRHVGRVSGRVGKTSLQEEFWREVDARRLPRTDSLERILLHLTDPAEVEASVFLHRLRITGVPYASYVGQQHAARRGRGKGKGAVAPDTADELEALARTREAWEAQWTPATDVALIERIVLGSTLEEVAARVLDDRLEQATSAGAAAGVLAQAAFADVPRALGQALAACEGLAARDDDLGSLARAASVLSSVVLWSSRASLDGEALSALCRKTFDRAVLRAPAACACDDEAAVAVRRALLGVHEVAMAQPLVDKAGWLAAAGELARSDAAHPSVAGLCLALLHKEGLVGDEELVAQVGQRVSLGLEPARAATFLAGFFEIGAHALVKLRPVVAALDAFLCGIEPARFRDALPVLRRAFGALGATERRYLLENVLSARKIGDKARAAQAVLAEKDKAKIAAMSADLAQAMDDLDDLL